MSKPEYAIRRLTSNEKWCPTLFWCGVPVRWYANEGNARRFKTKQAAENLCDRFNREYTSIFEVYEVKDEAEAAIATAEGRDK